MQAQNFMFKKKKIQKQDVLKLLPGLATDLLYDLEDQSS